MKTLKKQILSVIFFFTIVALSSQTLPPQPNGGQTPTEGGNTPVGGGAPVGSGLLVLLSLGVGFGATKVYHLNKRNLAE
jgi:hypothetical protein